MEMLFIVEAVPRLAGDLLHCLLAEAGDALLLRAVGDDLPFVMLFLHSKHNNLVYPAKQNQTKKKNSGEYQQETDLTEIDITSQIVMGLRAVFITSEK